MVPRLDVKPLAGEIVTLAVAGADDLRLKWRSPDRSRVTVVIGAIIPAEGPKQTVAGRRRRFSKALREVMTTAGWRDVSGTSPHTYERELGGSSPGAKAT